MARPPDSIRASIFMTDSIILLQDVRNTKEAKERELRYYEDILFHLKTKMDLLRREITLTDKIIRMIKADQVPKI